MSNLTPTAAERTAFTRAEFCVRNGISLSLYTKLKNLGLGPAEMQLGAATRITLTAEREWQERRANPQGEEAAQAALTKKKLIERARRAGKLAVKSPKHPASIKRAVGR